MSSRGSSVRTHPKGQGSKKGRIKKKRSKSVTRRRRKTTLTGRNRRKRLQSNTQYGRGHRASLGYCPTKQTNPVHNRVAEALLLFRSMDIDGDGIISKEDLMQTMKGNSGNGEVDEDHVNGIFQALADKNGEITKSGFIQNIHLFYEDPPEDSDEEKIDQNFEKSGKRSTKSFDRESISSAWCARELAKELTLDDGTNIKALAVSFFQIIDVHNNGAISLEEFKQSWKDLLGETGAQEDILAKVFHAMDTLNTGAITEAEFTDHFVKQPREIIETIASLLQDDKTSKKSTYEKKEDATSHATYNVQAAYEEEYEEDDMQSFEATSDTRQLEKMLQMRTRELQMMEQKLKHVSVTSQKINRKFEIVQQECDQSMKERHQLSRSRNELHHELESQKLQAIKNKEKAEQYKKLCESMKQKVELLEKGVKSAKENQSAIHLKLKSKSEKLSSTQKELNELKTKKKKQKKKERHHQKKMQSHDMEMKKQLKKQELELKRVREEKELFMKEMEELRQYKAIAEKRAHELEKLKKEVEEKKHIEKADLLEEIAPRMNGVPLNLQFVEREFSSNSEISKDTSISIEPLKDQNISKEPVPLEDQEVSKEPTPLEVREMRESELIEIEEEEEFEGDEGDLDEGDLDEGDLNDDIQDSNVDDDDTFIRLKFSIRADSPLSPFIRALVQKPPTEEMNKMLDQASNTLHHWAQINESSKEKKLLSNLVGFLLSKAKGIVLMNMLRAGLIIGGSSGSGVILSKVGSEWSGPHAIKTGGALIGLGAGMLETDTLIILTSDEALSSFAGGAFKVGGNMKYVAGPADFDSSYANLKDKKELAHAYSYNYCKGKFLAATLEGCYFNPRSDTNNSFYGKEVTARMILSHKVKPPKNTKYDTLIQTLNRMINNAPQNLQDIYGKINDNMKVEDEGPNLDSNSIKKSDASVGVIQNKELSDGKINQHEKKDLPRNQNLRVSSDTEDEIMFESGSAVKAFGNFMKSLSPRTFNTPRRIGRSMMARRSSRTSRSTSLESPDLTQSKRSPDSTPSKRTSK